MFLGICENQTRTKDLFRLVLDRPAGTKSDRGRFNIRGPRFPFFGSGHCFHDSARFMLIAVAPETIDRCALSGVSVLDSDRREHPRNHWVLVFEKPENRGYRMFRRLAHSRPAGLYPGIFQVYGIARE